MKALQPTTKFKKDLKKYKNKPDQLAKLIRLGFHSELFK